MKKNCVQKISFLFCSIGFLFNGQIFAQTHTESSGSGSQTYEPPTGEQPTYGKKFRPTEIDKNFVLELNPLMLIRKSLSFETEFKTGELVSLGADLIYENNEVFKINTSSNINGNQTNNTVIGNINYFGVSPKIRLYPMTPLNGVFFGAKLGMGQLTQKISDSNISKERSKFIVSPSVHAGYRFSTFNGFTMAFYLGGGLNAPNPKLEDSDIDASVRTNTDWRSAKDKVNSNFAVFKPDFGLTLGIAL
jgi:hypothetical protein